MTFNQDWKLKMFFVQIYDLWIYLVKLVILLLQVSNLDKDIGSNTKKSRHIGKQILSAMKQNFSIQTECLFHDRKFCFEAGACYTFVLCSVFISMGVHACKLVFNCNGKFLIYSISAGLINPDCRLRGLRRG